MDCVKCREREAFGDGILCVRCGMGELAKITARYDPHRRLPPLCEVPACSHECLCASVPTKPRRKP